MSRTARIPSETMRELRELLLNAIERGDTDDSFDAIDTADLVYDLRVTFDGQAYGIRFSVELADDDDDSGAAT